MKTTGEKIDKTHTLVKYIIAGKRKVISCYHLQCTLYYMQSADKITCKPESVTVALECLDESLDEEEDNKFIVVSSS